MPTIKSLIERLQKDYDLEEKYFGNITSYEEILEQYDSIQRPVVLDVLNRYKNFIDTVEELENILQEDSKF